MDQEVREALLAEIAGQKAVGEEPQDWYFTFGGDHQENGVNLGRKYIKFHGTYGEARLQMFERFDRQWSHQYESAERAGVHQFGLTEHK
jgi:hypothetical protein